MSFIQRDGYRIWFEEVGSGDPVLLLAGLGLDSSVWEQTVRSLSPSHRCILIDNRGVGRSTGTAGMYSIDSMADDCAAVLDSLEESAVSAVGWSMGGVILQSMLGRRPDLVSKAVLLSTMPRYTPVQHAWLDALLRLRALDLDPAVVAAFGTAWTHTARSLTDHDQVWATAVLSSARSADGSDDAFASQAAGLRIYDSRPHLPNVGAGVLILVGAEDILTPPSQSIAIADLIPGAHLRILPRGGHAMILEYPGDTVAAITEFFGT